MFAQARLRAEGCPTELVQTFESLLALEIPEAELSRLTVSLRCESLDAVVRVERDARHGERTLSRAAPDLARWLALAARELSDTIALAQELPAATPEGSSSKPAPPKFRPWLAARLGRGDRPRTLPFGAELGVSYGPSNRWLGAEGFVLGAGAKREITDSLEVRKLELGAGMGLTVGTQQGPFEWEASLGAQLRWLRLSARIAAAEGEGLDLNRWLWGPYAALSLRVWLTPRWALSLRPAMAILWPETRGKNQAGDSLYIRKPATPELALGVSLAL